MQKIYLLFVSKTSINANTNSNTDKSKTYDSSSKNVGLYPSRLSLVYYFDLHSYLFRHPLALC